MVSAVSAKADAAGAATGGRGRSLFWDDENAEGWRDWWRRGDRHLDDIDDWMRRRHDNGDRRGWAGRISRGMLDFEDHLRRWDRRWDGDNRYGAVFDDWSRRWGGLRGRWQGRDWGRGDWRYHDGPYRQMHREFDGLRMHWGQVRDGWWRGRRDGERGERRIYSEGYRPPGTEMGGWR